jgi:hypothetical protein
MNGGTHKTINIQRTEGGFGNDVSIHPDYAQISFGGGGILRLGLDSGECTGG